MFYIHSILRVKGIQGLSHFPIMIISFRDECFFLAKGSVVSNAYSYIYSL